MSYRENLKEWVAEALGKLGGQAYINDVARQIWLDHESELRSWDEHFYSWQYDMRWAAQHLRNKNVLSFHKVGSKSRWVLK